MTKTPLVTQLAVCLLSLPLFAEEAKPVKYLDTFHLIDPKTLRGSEVKMQVVSGDDAAHGRALQLTADFANPGTYTNLSKTFPAGTINPKRHTGVRFFIKSPTGTRVSISMGGNYHRQDGRHSAFHGRSVVATDQWQEVKILFSEFKRQGGRYVKNGVAGFVQGGDPMEEFEIGQMSRIWFSMSEETRGNSVVAKVLLEGLALVE